MIPEQRFIGDAPFTLDNGRLGTIHFHRCDECAALTANFGDSLMHARFHGHTTAPLSLSENETQEER